MTATLTPEKFDEVTEALKDVMDPELGINIRGIERNDDFFRL